MLNNFKIEELVDSATNERLKSLAWKIFDFELLLSLQELRAFTNKTFIINNWKDGGQFSYRGYRPPECKQGALVSAHRFGRAIDFHVADGSITAEEMRKLIIKNRDKFPGIKRMESGVNWVHIDSNYTGVKDIVLFKP